MPCDAPLPQRLWNRIRASILIMVAALSLMLTVVWTDAVLQSQLRTVDREELVYVPPARFLKLVSLGYQHALADVLWFRTTAYFSRHYRSDRVYPWLAYMCNVVTDLDPAAQHVYRFGGLILPWEADGVDDGIALLEKGSRNLPEAWELSYMLGFSYYFFKNDLATAVQALRRAALSSNAPPFVAHLAALIESARQGPAGAIEFLTELDRRGTNEEIRGTIHERIGELVLARDIDALDTAVETFQTTHHRMPGQLTELVSAGILAAIPREPFGGEYVLDTATGRVRSNLGRRPLRLSSSALRENLLKSRHVEPSGAQQVP